MQEIEKCRGPEKVGNQMKSEIGKKVGNWMKQEIDKSSKSKKS